MLTVKLNREVLLGMLLDSIKSIRSLEIALLNGTDPFRDDLSYNHKHNEANGEDNRDGANDNFSWNCGGEGPTEDSDVERLRLQQIKNLFVILMISHGTPMLLVGDEVRRSQLGNNNAYCQDSELSWFNWNDLEKHAGLLRFVKGLIHFVQSLEIFQQEKILPVTYESQESHIVWHGVALGQPDWESDSHSLAFTLCHPMADEYLHILLNAYREPLTFELPPMSRGQAWHRIVDTALPTPEDFCSPKVAPAVVETKYRASARSSVILMANSDRISHIPS